MESKCERKGTNDETNKPISQSVSGSARNQSLDPSLQDDNINS